MKIYRSDQQVEILLPLLILLLVVCNGCTKRPNPSSTTSPAKTQSSATADPNQPPWLPTGYTIPPGKRVTGIEGSGGNFRFGEHLDIVRFVVDPVTMENKTNVLVGDVIYLTVFQETNADGNIHEKMAIEWTPDQADILMGMDSPGHIGLMPHGIVAEHTTSEPLSQGTRAQHEVIVIYRGTNAESVNFTITNYLASTANQH